MQTESLIATEAECAEGRTAPRVSLTDIEANIAFHASFTAEEAVQALGSYGWLHGVYDTNDTPASLAVLTVCLIVTRNGFTIIGKSAPASADNFDAELGRKLAYEDAVRHLWPLMGYALREKLHNEETTNGR